jgi:hypothetical protein
MWKLRFRQTENHHNSQAIASFFEEVIPEDINKMVKIWMNIENLKEILRESSKMNEIITA